MSRQNRNRNYKCGLSPQEKRHIKHDLWKLSKLCNICGKDLPSLKLATLDHVIPMAKGGADEAPNLKLTHLKCNNKKGDKLV